MYVDLIDRLRCPHEHADTWLVAAATRTAHRRLIEATLGCHECGAEYELRDGEVWFGARVERAPMAVNADETMRAAALLRLEERGLYLLEGGWGSLAAALQQVLDVDIILADPPTVSERAAADASVDGVDALGKCTLRGVGDRWPVAGAALHGIAMERATDARLSDALRVLRDGGRLIAPASAPVPAGARELARDERHWVAEKVGDVIALSRARR
ncbi:MAG: hypothetical protein WC700_17400 [Gemmatimonadaceae bacterium]|jgi:hypothetical protein